MQLDRRQPEFQEGHVLHYERIHARFVVLPYKSFCLSEFVGFQKSVDSGIDSCSEGVGIAAQ